MRNPIEEYLKKVAACNHLDNYNPMINKYATPNYLKQQLKSKSK